MKSPLVYAGNMIRKGFLKIRYGSKLHMGNIQSFQHIGMEIRNGGKISIGSYCQNRGKVWLICDGGKLTIGDHCFFNINSSITCVENITIGDNCKFGNNLVIVDHDHNYKRKDESEPEFVGSPITIGDNTWIGADVVILRGTKIGKNCVIGAGSVVKGEISNDSVVIQKNRKMYMQGNQQT